jgi:hypothetical protein
VLDFEKGPDGYKTRCPSCGSVVRLKATKTKRRSKQKSARHGRLVRDVPPEHWAASALDQRVGRAVTCELCHTRVPVEALKCPGCGAALAVTTAAPLLEDEPCSPLHATVANLRSRLHLLCLIAGAAVVAVAAAALVLFLHH